MRKERMASEILQTIGSNKHSLASAAHFPQSTLCPKGVQPALQKYLLGLSTKKKKMLTAVGCAAPACNSCWLMREAMCEFFNN